MLLLGYISIDYPVVFLKIPRGFSLEPFKMLYESFTESASSLIITNFDGNHMIKLASNSGIFLYYGIRAAKQTNLTKFDSRSAKKLI